MITVNVSNLTWRWRRSELTETKRLSVQVDYIIFSFKSLFTLTMTCAERVPVDIDEVFKTRV